MCGIVEDEHFEFGDDGEEAFENIGPFLVSARARAAQLRAAKQSAALAALVVSAAAL